MDRGELSLDVGIIINVCTSWKGRRDGSMIERDQGANPACHVCKYRPRSALEYHRV